MPKKKTEELEEKVEAAVEAPAAEETPVEAKADDVAAEAEPKAEAKKAAPKKSVKAEGSDEKKPAKARKAKAESTDVAEGEKKAIVHKRAEKIGVVASDKMTKTVTVRVDRLVKHPIYRKYVRKRKKFMAHDELGAKIGDKVRIIETRPMSARKRWRVVEIIQKAEL